MRKPGKGIVFGLAIVLGAAIMQSQTRPASPSPKPAAPAASAAAERALLDQYCVTCHNDKLKTANLSLEKLDLTTAGDRPEVWERVVRTLRADVMPPPD